MRAAGTIASSGSRKSEGKKLTSWYDKGPTRGEIEGFALGLWMRLICVAEAQ